jgi:hypothetical protein
LNRLNLGDIEWVEIFKMKSGREETWGTVSTYAETKEEFRYIKNYDEVKKWFHATYPESNWNDKNGSTFNKSNKQLHMSPKLPCLSDPLKVRPYD